MKQIEAWNPPIDWIREQIEVAGTRIGSVHFNKRKSGELRKMSYRLHVTHPSVAKAPVGVEVEVDESTTLKNICVCGLESCTTGPFTKIIQKKVDKVDKKKVNKKVVDKKNNQMTVFDANKVVRDKDGNYIGRGAYRTVPLENVTRICNNGREIIIKQY